MATHFIATKVGNQPSESLDHIFARKEAERWTGGDFWWGLGQRVVTGLEDAVRENPEALPVLFVNTDRGGRRGSGGETLIWRSWRRSKEDDWHDIPRHAVVTSPVRDEQYALVCSSDNPLRSFDSRIEVNDYPTVNGKEMMGTNLITGLLVGNPYPFPGGKDRVVLDAKLAKPFFPQLGNSQRLTKAQRAELAEWAPQTDWLSLAVALRGGTETVPGSQDPNNDVFAGLRPRGSSGTEPGQYSVTEHDVVMQQLEAELLDRYDQFRLSSGLSDTPLLELPLPLPGQTRPIVADAFDKEHNLLIEAKSSAEREYIRMAIGQIFDYERYVPTHPDLAILLPNRPTQELVDLIVGKGIRLIFESGSQFVQEPPTH